MVNRPETTKQKGSQKARNSAARLLAVQTVYQMHKNNQDAKTAIAEFLEHRSGGVDADGDEMVSPNEDHYALVVRGVAEHQAQLNEMIALNRGEKGAKTQESEPLLQSILLCAGFELMVLQSIDFPVIISDYLHVTHAFYDEGEAKLVNGLLDSIRKTVRDA